MGKGFIKTDMQGCVKQDPELTKRMPEDFRQNAKKYPRKIQSGVC